MEPWGAGPAGRRGPIPEQSVAGPPGVGRHVSAPPVPATHSVGSMSATAVSRKRGKPASGARAGAGAGKRRRKVSMALLRAGVRPATGPTFILSYPHLDPLPGPSPGTPSWSELHHSLCPPNPGRPCIGIGGHRLTQSQGSRETGRGPSISAGVIETPDQRKDRIIPRPTLPGTGASPKVAAR